MTTSEVGPWAKVKLDGLRKYLEAYTEILKKYRYEYHYIDAFAGPGQYTVRQAKPSGTGVIDWGEPANFLASEAEQQQFIAGSPRVALEIKHPFRSYYFIERDPDRITSLHQLRVEWPNTRIAIVQGNCNDELRTIVRSMNWSSNRAVVFLDPFGMQVPWSTVSMLGGTKAIDVFINFPLGMAIQRLLPQDVTKITSDKRARLDEYFGGEDWYDAVYHPVPQQRQLRSLFDDEEIPESPDAIKGHDSGYALVRWYRERLRTVFKFVSAAKLIRNSRGGHLYYLIVASQNEVGVKIADHILDSPDSVR